jgi:hypothetical protein
LLTFSGLITIPFVSLMTDFSSSDSQATIQFYLRNYLKR